MDQKEQVMTDYTLRAGETVFISSAELTIWTTMARVGESTGYALGSIAFDLNRSLDSFLLKEVARTALKLSNEGKVDLVQRKVTEGCYEYIAIKRPT